MKPFTHTLFWLLLVTFGSQAQSRYFTRTGNISFFSEEIIENIEAHNKQVSSFLDVTTGEIVFSVPMKAFQFRKSLMQEHFNENYVESHKYPKSTFKGTVQNIRAVNLQQDGVYKVKVNGQLTIHGVTKPIDADGTLEVKGGRIGANSIIYVRPEDYDIRIPLLVRNHIAKIIQVTINLLYEPYQANAAKQP
jgi:polyisoprenoid-binding protein YceI